MDTHREREGKGGRQNKKVAQSVMYQYPWATGHISTLLL